MKPNDNSLLGGLFGAEVAEAVAVEKAAEDAAEAARREAARDHLGEKLIADGFADSEYSLDLNDSIFSYQKDEPLEYPWNLPSRLFQFGIRSDRGPGPATEDNDGDGMGPRWIGVAHPLLMDHPRVKKLQAAGYEVIADPDDPRCVNKYGVPMTHTECALWWHAVDLIKNHWKELIDTRRFTTDNDILAAVAFKLQWGVYGEEKKTPISKHIADMRWVLAQLGSQEPAYTPQEIVKVFDRPSPITTDHNTGKPCKAYYNVNKRFGGLKTEPEAHAWGLIHAYEHGWIDRKIFPRWTEKGVSEFYALVPSEKADEEIDRDTWGDPDDEEERDDEDDDNTGPADGDEDEEDGDLDYERDPDNTIDPDCEECFETPCVCGCPDCGEVECECGDLDDEGQGDSEPVLKGFNAGIKADAAEKRTPSEAPPQMGLFG